MNRPTIIGVDPGPTPGIAVVRTDGQTEALQMTAGVLEEVLRGLFCGIRWEHPVGEHGYIPPRPHAVLAVEKYVIGRRSTRVKAAGANALTARMVGALEQLGAELRVPVLVRPAAEVKPWATAGAPSRVERVFGELTGMVHARSAAWHATFAAVADAGHPDPLSKRGRS